MADLPNTTQDVTLFDNESANYADINDNHELLTHDTAALTLLDEVADGSKDIHFYQERGEAYYITFSATLTNKDTQYPVILITNPNGSGKHCEFQHIDISAVTIGGGVYAKLRMYANPTITSNGTAITQTNANIGSNVTSGVNTYHSPTITSNGTLLSYQSSTLVQPHRAEHWLGTGILPNNSILFTLDSTGNGTTVQIAVKFVSYTES